LFTDKRIAQILSYFASDKWSYSSQL